MGKKYNFIIFGATGFTGKYLLLEILNAAETGNNDTKEKLTWAMAGRSVTKMDVVLDQILKDSRLKVLNKDEINVDKIVADASNEESIRAMVKQCDVVLNCVGPYLRWGEVVVKACVEEGTHYIDTSAEPFFLQRMSLKYREAAEASGTYIISGCGLDSVPSDYGCAVIQNEFEGTVNSVESYCVLPCGFSRFSLPKLSYGTWSTMILMNSSIREQKDLRNQLYGQLKIYNDKNKLQSRILKYCQDVDGWCVRLQFPFDCDKAVMNYTQQYKFNQGLKPIQTQAYYKPPNRFTAIGVLVAFYMLKWFTKPKFGKYLALNAPKLMSFGMASKHGPSEEEIDAKFTFILVAQGWDKISHGKDELGLNPTNKLSVLKIEFNNGYHSSAKMMLQAGITVLTQHGELPQRGGIYTPGIAFANTSLKERLCKNGIIFQFCNH